MNKDDGIAKAAHQLGTTILQLKETNATLVRACRAALAWFQGNNTAPQWEPLVEQLGQALTTASAEQEVKRSPKWLAIYGALVAARVAL
jgi:hypothetical protein